MIITKSLTSFFIGLGLSFLFFGGLNLFSGGLEELFFLRDLPPAAFQAELTAGLPLPKSEKAIRPIVERDTAVAEFQTQAKAALAVLFDESGKEQVLFKQSADQRLPIASLTKLMTALVAHEQYGSYEEITIAELMPEDNGSLKIGETFTVADLLAFVLINSNNSAAHALAAKLGPAEFLALMNQKAAKIGMRDTFFYNSMGLDPDLNDEDKANFSTATDMVKLLRPIWETPPLVALLGTSRQKILPKDTTRSYLAVNTNKFLGQRPDVIFGKTGWTPQAKGCLVLLAEAPNKKGLIAAVILGSDNRFGEMENLLDWLEGAYLFEDLDDTD